jgi:hypothetical protein
MTGKATSVEGYLADLPADRRRALEAVRSVILRHLDEGFEEGIQYGMIGYFVPHHLYPAGYHADPAQPLPFLHLASQKNYMAIYLMCLYADDALLDRFQTAWKKTGKRLDMGKSCVRFRRLEDLALDVIAETVGSVTARAFVDRYKTQRPKKKSTPKKTAARPTKKTRRPAKRKRAT